VETDIEPRILVKKFNKLNPQPKAEKRSCACNSEFEGKLNVIGVDSERGAIFVYTIAAARTQANTRAGNSERLILDGHEKCGKEGSLLNSICNQWSWAQPRNTEY
jgi:hypothetical protein